MTDSKITIKKLESAIRLAEKDVAKAPEEVLNIISSKNYSYYYLKNVQTNERYSTTKEDPRVVRSAQADYAKMFLAVAGKVLSKMKKAPEVDYQKELCSVFEKLHPQRKVIVTPYILSPNQYAEQWQKQTWTNKNSYETPGLCRTLRDEQVRSKTEVIIANLLYYAGIPYLYEKPLILSNGQVRYPDFTILNKRTGEEYILEHFGKMDDPEYSAKAWKKIFDYGNAGYVLGKKFVFTFEEANQPFNDSLLNNYINTLFT